MNNNGYGVNVSVLTTLYISVSLNKYKPIKTTAVKPFFFALCIKYLEITLYYQNVIHLVQ